MGWKRGQAYSQDLRDRVLEARDQGMSCRQVAERFSVSPSYVVKVVARRDRTGQTSVGGRGRPARKLASHEAALSAHVAENPDATLAERRRWLAEARGVSVAVKTVWTALRQLRLRFKKKPCARPSSTGLILPAPAAAGTSGSVISILTASSSSTRWAPRPS